MLTTLLFLTIELRLRLNELIDLAEIHADAENTDYCVRWNVVHAELELKKLESNGDNRSDDGFTFYSTLDGLITPHQKNGIPAQADVTVRLSACCY